MGHVEVLQWYHSKIYLGGARAGGFSCFSAQLLLQQSCPGMQHHFQPLIMNLPPFPHS